MSHHAQFQLPGWMGTRNEEWLVTIMPQGCRFASYDENRYRNELNSIRVSPIIRANFCWVKIPNYQLHDSHTRSPIAATMPFPIINVSTINPNIVNSEHSPSCMNMNDVIIE